MYSDTRNSDSSKRIPTSHKLAIFIVFIISVAIIKLAILISSLFIHSFFILSESSLRILNL
ncbi:TPA: hypothetical protein DEG21_00100 [Patescibacteria group bacterium]|nr:hypothetical protein [Candidatus Gracilibacteria bacterium]